ncbi:MAG: permease [Leptospiraceae bacterium]
MLSDEVKKLVYLLGAFALIFLYPLNSPDASRALLEGFFMLQDYIREHTLTCLVPALFIAGAVAAFVSQVAIIKYFAGGVSAWISYSVASVSGTMLAVCSCTVLPLFSSIYRRGAGLGPAIAFLYSGPAINVLAIILTARILGWELGAVRFAVSVLFAAGIGWIMQLLFPSNEEASVVPIQGVRERPLWQDMVLFLSLIGFLLAATLSAPEEFGTFYSFIYSIKWWLAAGFLGLVLLSSMIFFRRDERRTWMEETWSFTKLIVPYLFIGVFVAGWLLGRPGTEAGLIPAHYIESLVGGESFQACLFASLSGALMYFATLTEIPILQGLLGAGMGKGPALSLLLAGPAISLPSLLALRSIMGWKKTVVYALLVILFSTLAGYFFGAI